jgi:circadian clock protein KaiC
MGFRQIPQEEFDVLSKRRERRPTPLAKAPTGIPGFDEITQGGIPVGRTTIVMGAAGAGKTVFALQLLVHTARDRGEAGIFVAFEENSQQLIANGATFGWDLPALRRKKLFFLDARISPDVVSAGSFDLAGMLAVLAAKAKAMRARFIVFDGLDLLLDLLADPSAERRELCLLRTWLANEGLTAIITAKSDRLDSIHPRHYTFLPFLMDCVIVLHHELVDDTSLRDLQVLKYRGSNFAANKFPLVIGRAGLQVAGPNGHRAAHAVSRKRLSSGVPRLDTMLGGRGYYRGSTVLISGSPGTAKTTLAGAFVDAACSQGERAIFVSFDEFGAEIVRNLTSVGIRLQRHLSSGLLRIHSDSSATKSSEEHLLAISTLIDEHQPRVVVVDPLSALVNAGGSVAAQRVIARLIHATKSRQITLLGTSLVDTARGAAEAALVPVSTIADTWIHVTYVSQAGERNRALTIVKSRGTHHSNQVRELILSRQGITLSDVYSAAGEVLIGTARWQREDADRVALRESELRRLSKQRELAIAEEELRGRIDVLTRELALRRAAVEAAAAEFKATGALQSKHSEQLKRLRFGDKQEPARKGRRVS